MSFTAYEPVTIPDGKYTVVRPDGRLTIRVRTQPPHAYFRPRETIVSYLAGPDNQHDYVGFGFLTDGALQLWKRFKGNAVLTEAVEALLGDPHAACSAYGM